jgi:DNA polymerase-4
MEILARTGAQIEQMSIDEAYLDFSAVFSDAQNFDEGILPDSIKLARQIKENIFRERRLTATIGIASNKLLAKLASDFQKPDGLTLIPDRDKVLFLRPMSVRAIHGVGKVTEQILNGAGIQTAGDVQDFSADLRKLVGSFGATLKRFAFGEDDRVVETHSETKSISSEETFDRDTTDKRLLRDCLREQSMEIANELKEKKLGAHTIHVKIRYSNFETLTRQITVEEPVNEAEEIFRLGCFLLAREKLANRPVRLLGAGVSGFDEPMAKQLHLNLPSEKRAEQNKFVPPPPP